ncbi:hypothetical protein CROQUDRAFT_62516, partial [Cronartium quercuum f. sp. fusiforme G11]
NPDIGQVNCTVSHGRNTSQASPCHTKTEVYSCEERAVADTYAIFYNCITSRQI